MNLSGLLHGKSLSAAMPVLQGARASLCPQMEESSACERCAILTMRDGIDLRFGIWRHVARHRRGAVLLLQGRAEFIEKHGPIIGDLRRRGFDVLAFDWRGQGGSARLCADPQTGHVGCFGDYETDLVDVIDQVFLPQFRPPHFALGHCLGGLVFLSCAPRLRTRLERAILVAPMLDMRLPLGRLSLAVQLFLARRAGRMPSFLLRSTTRWFDEEGAQAEPFIDDEGSERAGLEACPDLRIGPPGGHWIGEIVNQCRYLARDAVARRPGIPALLIGTGADAAVSGAAGENFARIAPAVDYVEIPGTRHDLPGEAARCRRQFWAAFDQFMELPQ